MRLETLSVRGERAQPRTSPLVYRSAVPGPSVSVEPGALGVLKSSAGSGLVVLTGRLFELGARRVLNSSWRTARPSQVPTG